jgi:hypothetical protein
VAKFKKFSNTIPKKTIEDDAAETAKPANGKGKAKDVAFDEDEDAAIMRGEFLLANFLPPCLSGI